MEISKPEVMSIMGAGKSKIASDMNFDLAVLNALPEASKKAIENHFESQEVTINELKESYDRFKVDSERKQFELEKQLIASNQKGEQESKTAAVLRQQLADIEARYAEASQSKQEAEDRATAKEQQFAEEERAKNQLLAEKEDLTSILERRDQEIQRLTEEWKCMSQKVAEANKARIESIAKLDEIQSHDVSTQHRTSRLQQEVESLQRQVEWLETEVNDKTKLVMETRREKTSLSLELQSKVSEQEDTISHQEAIVESLRDTNQQLTANIESLSTKLKESQNNQTQLEEQFNNEIQAQKKLISIYKDSSTEAEGKVGELLRAVEELQALLKNATQANQQLEDQRKHDVQQCHDVIQQRDELVARLQQELVDANELCTTLEKKCASAVSEEAIAAMSPAAARASALLKSGMTLTQIYSEYARATEELATEREEKTKLNQYLDQILQEIEEKAPVLKKQREDYEKSIVTIEHLTNQLDGAMVECDKLQNHADESSRLRAEATRENGRLRQQCADLSQQVRVLVKELEEARGNVVSLDEDDGVTSSTDGSSSAVITQQLVSFRSITELQEQNQKLIQVVRNLSEEKEKEEKDLHDTKSRELREELTAVQEELVRLQESRQRQAQQVETLVRQRDMYYVLLKQNAAAADSADTPPMPRPQATDAPRRHSPEKSASEPAGKEAEGGGGGDVSGEALREATNALKELQQEFATYRKEKAENERMIEEQLDKFRKEASDMKVQNARLASQLDYGGERTKILESNIDGYKKEIVALRDKNSKYTANVSRLEEVVATLRQEVQDAQGRAARAEVQAQNLRTERDMLKAIEQRLLADQESRHREQRSHQLMMANLQAIQNNLERSEFETKTQLTERISQMEKEAKVLRQRLNTAEGQHRGATSIMEKQLAELKEKLGAEELAHTDTKKLLQEAEQQVQQLRNDLSKTEAQFAAAESRLTNVAVQRSSVGSAAAAAAASGGVGGAVAGEELKDARTQLQQAHTDIKALKSQVVKFKQHADQYKEIADKAEGTMAEQTKQNEELKAWMESRVAEAAASRESAEKQVAALEADRNKLLDENQKLSEDSRAQCATLRGQLTATQAKLAEVSERVARTAADLEQARADRETQARLAKEAQEKYEREMVQHAATMEQHRVAKGKAESARADIAAAQDAHQLALEQLNTAKGHWAEQEEMMKQDKGHLEQRITELQEQNSRLHDELEQVTTQMSKLQQHTAQEDALAAELAKSVAAGDSAGDQADTKANEQLLQVIKFVRKEKEVAVARLEVLEAERERMKHQLTTAQKQLEEARQSINSEREKAQVSIQTAAEHAELLLKVEQVNLLTESNRFLREEKERLNAQLKEADTKLVEVTGRLEPLAAREAEATAGLEAARTEIRGLEEELKRWKARTTHLIEQCNKADPEEINRLTGEVERCQQRINQLTDESSKARAEVTRLQSQLAARATELTQAKTELTAAKQATTTANGELDKAKTQDQERLKTITQLKQVARRYREQNVKLQKDLDEQKAKLPKVSVEELQASIRGHESEVARLKQQVTELETQARDAQQQLQAKLQEAGDEAERRLKEKTDEAETRIKAATEQNDKIQKMIDELKAKMAEEQKKTQTEKDAKTEAEGRFKAILGQCRTKISSQKQQIETLTTENSELKNKNPSTDPQAGEADKRLKAMQSQMSSQKQKLQQLQTELAEARAAADTDIETLNKENAALKEKIASLKKQLEQSPASAASTVATTTTSTSAAAESGPVRTANIRPLSSPATAQQRQSAPVQPAVRTATETPRATASIRPMAAASTGTPTATVMPTTIHDPPVQQQQTQQGEGTSHAAPQQQQVPPQVRQVQPVSPHIDDTTPAATATQPLPTPTQQEESTFPQPSPPPQSEESSEPGLVTPAAVAAAVAAVAEPTPGTSTQVSVQPVVPSTSTTTKRPRDDNLMDEDDEEEVAQKRQRSMVAPQQHVTESEQDTLPEYMDPDQEPTPMTSAPVALVEPAQQQQAADHEQADDTATDTIAPQVEMAAEEEEQEEMNEETEAPEECLVIGDEEEEEEDAGAEEGEEEEEQYPEEAMEEEEGYDVEDEEDEEEEHMPEQEEEEEEEEEVEEGGEDDVILVDDDDEEEGGDEEAEDQSAAPSTATTSQAAANVPPATRPQLQFSSMTAAESGAGVGSIFEEDGIVPSTPTLSIPRRTDGFAEAVNSPQVQQTASGFSFGGSSGSAIEVVPFGQSLSSQESMNETSIDLVPQIMETPSISVSEASGDATAADTSSPQQDSSSQQEVAASPGQGSATETPAPEEAANTRSEQDSDNQPIPTVDSSAGQQRPRIEPIVWDASSPQPQQQQQQAIAPVLHGVTLQPTQPQQPQPPAPGRRYRGNQGQHRGGSRGGSYHGGMSRGGGPYRGRGGGGAMRGTRGGGTRGGFRQQQQPPF